MKQINIDNFVKYTSFSFKNFKGIQETDILVDEKGLFTLVGRNESGKTTILKAIEATYKLLSGKEKDIERDSIMPKGANFSSNISFSVKIDLIEAQKDKLFKGKTNSNQIECSFEFCYDRGSFKELKSSITGFKKQPNDADLIKIRDYIAKNCPPVLLYDNFLEENPDSVVFYHSESKAEDTTADRIYNGDLNIKWKEILNDIARASYGDTANIQEDIVDRDKTLTGVDKQNIDAMNKHLTDTFKKYWDALYPHKKISKIEIDRQVERVINSTSKKNIFSILVYSADGTSYTQKERSMGFKWFFSFLLFTKFRQNRHKRSLFLIDEPASNLYSSSQESVLKALADLSKDACVIYTTHSPYLCSGQYLGNSYYVKNNDTEANQKANIKAIMVNNVDPNDKEFREYARTILDSFSLKHVIQLSNRNCFLEGITDWALLNLFGRLLSDKLKDIALIHGRGSSTLSPEISSARGYNKKFLVCLDSDKGGQDAILYYQKEFPIIDIKSKLKTLKELSNNDDSIKDLESLFLDSEKEKIIELASLNSLSLYKKTTNKKSKKTIFGNSLIEINEKILLDISQKNILDNVFSVETDNKINTIIQSIINYLN